MQLLHKYSLHGLCCHVVKASGKNRKTRPWLGRGHNGVVKSEKVADDGDQESGNTEPATGPQILICV